MASLLDLVPARGSYIPDFLTPLHAGPDLESGIDALLSTPQEQVRAELAPLVAAGLAPERVRPLFDGDPAAWRRLADAIREYHTALIAPHSATVEGQLNADRAARVHALAAVGVERVLNTLDPRMRWNTRTLSYECAPNAEWDLDLDGRGLILQPSLFTYEPSVLAVDGHPAVLIYPTTVQDQPPQPGRSLVTLLGRTRAAILTAIADGASTTQLAHRTGVSLASASQHAAVLRGAGLILTRRIGPAVLHTLTPVGMSLLTRQGRTHTPVQSE
jgi:DNA-binding transcriptional ArsR family regulator